MKKGLVAWRIEDTCLMPNTDYSGSDTFPSRSFPGLIVHRLASEREESTTALPSCTVVPVNHSLKLFSPISCYHDNG
jgi:hypothetical protein